MSIDTSFFSHKKLDSVIEGEGEDGDKANEGAMTVGLFQFSFYVKKSNSQTTGMVKDLTVLYRT